MVSSPLRARPAVGPEGESRGIRELLVTNYKNLDQPDFGFVSRVFDARPYEPLIKRMRDYAVVEELVQAEEDVCFGYLIKGQSTLWKLDLSVVGPFGLFVRLKQQITAMDVLRPGDSTLTGFETKAVDLMKGGGIKLLSADELSREVPLRLFNSANGVTTLYQALFTDRPKLPWAP